MIAVIFEVTPKPGHSDDYFGHAARLAPHFQAKLRANDQQLWQRHADYLQAFLGKPNYADEAQRLGIAERLEMVRRRLE